tara:strand:- start:668 stop:817 length:150 start_codon:yes stop_codon:yes gene_type:complete
MNIPYPMRGVETVDLSGRNLWYVSSHMDLFPLILKSELAAALQLEKVWM